jgi:hypothetical protein
MFSPNNPLIQPLNHRIGPLNGMLASVSRGLSLTWPLVEMDGGPIWPKGTGKGKGPVFILPGLWAAINESIGAP